MTASIVERLRKQGMFDGHPRQDLYVDAANRIEALEAALQDVMQWVDSPEVTAIFHKMGTLSLTHKHLAVPVSKEFSEKAGATLQAARRVMEERNGPDVS